MGIYTSDTYRKRHERGLHQGYWYAMRLARMYRDFTIKVPDWYTDRMREFASAYNLNENRRRYSS